MMPDLVQAVEDTCKDLMTGVHTAMPAKITGYANGRVDAQISGKYYIGGEAMDYPLITGCPVVSGMCGAYTDVVVGDSCLLIFTEQSLSEWTSGTQNNTDEKWSLMNAVAICGLFKEAPSGMNLIWEINDLKRRVTALEQED